MAQWEQSKDGNTYHLPARTNWAEVTKVLTALRNEEIGDSDDAVVVTADSDGIRFTAQRIQERVRVVLDANEVRPRDVLVSDGEPFVRVQEVFSLGQQMWFFGQNASGDLICTKAEDHHSPVHVDVIPRGRPVGSHHAHPSDVTPVRFEEWEPPEGPGVSGNMAVLAKRMRSLKH